MFESSSKSRKSWNGRQMVWQCIPSIWSNRWKMIWKLQWWFYVEERILRKTKKERSGRAGTYLGVRDEKIGWLLRLEHSESNCSNFETNSVANRKPMQIRKDRCDVAEPRFLCDNSSKSILDTLKASQIWNGCASQERVAVINLEHFCQGTNVWVTSKTTWTGRWPEFLRSPKHGSSVGMSAKDSLTSKTWIVKKFSKIYKTQSPVPPSTCWTWSLPGFSRSPKHGGSVEISAMDSLTPKIWIVEKFQKSIRHIHQYLRVRVEPEVYLDFRGYLNMVAL